MKRVILWVAFLATSLTALWAWVDSSQGAEGLEDLGAAIVALILVPVAVILGLLLLVEYRGIRPWKRSKK